MNSRRSYSSLQRLPVVGTLVVTTMAISGLTSNEAYAQVAVACQAEFQNITSAAGGKLDDTSSSIPNKMVYVTVPLLPVDDGSYDGQFTVKFSKSDGTEVELEAISRPDVFEGKVIADRYELTVDTTKHGLVAPRRYVTVRPPANGSNAITIPTYISKAPIPYYRMDRSLIPFKPEPDLIAAVFQAEPPDDLPNADDPPDTPEATKFAQKIKGNSLGIEPLQHDPVRGIRYVSNHGTVWMFKLHNPSKRQDAIAYLRSQLRWPARIGVPINLRDGNFNVLDNYFVVLAHESQIKANKKLDPQFIPFASPVRWLTPAKNRMAMGRMGHLLIKFDEDRTFCQNIRAIELAHKVSLIGEPDLLARLYDSQATDTLNDSWPGDEDYINEQIKESQAHTLQHIREAWRVLYGTASNNVVITSANIFIATVDMGINPSDPDVVCDSSDARTRQLADCYDYPKGKACTSRTKHWHGTSVFGIVSACASNDKIGPVGVAPGAHHIVISRPFYTATTSYADALRYVGGISPSCWEPITTDASNPCPKKPLSKPADIISNSNSFTWDPAGGPPLFTPTAGYELPDATDQALKLLVETGRGGRGTVLLYAAGNEERLVSYHEPMARDSRVLGVANCYWDSATKSIKPYQTSNFGEEVDLCGIGNGSVTIRAACESNASACAFGGTSAATPTVAGVVALMLSANPDLCWWQAQDIVRSSVTDYTDTNAAAGERRYGAGLIDAQKAVIMAKDLPRLPAAQCSQ